MHSFLNTYFLAPKQAGNEYLSPAAGLGLLILFAIALLITGYLGVYLDPAFNVATVSRALYVDEGFYSDAAQNFTKFGSWGLVYDSRHWPGAPLLMVIQATFFSIFGVSLSVARMISIGFGIVSLLSIYAIARTKLSTLISLLLAVAAVLTFSFTAHSRMGIADPVATAFSLLAIATYVRLRNRHWAIPLSLFFAYMAICSKMYFLFALVTIITVWVFEVIILPILNRQKINWFQVAIIVASLCLIALSYAAIRIRFDDAFAQFLHINRNKTSSLNPIVLIRQLYVSLQHLPFNSKTHIGMIVLFVLLSYWVLNLLRTRDFSSIKNSLVAWDRSGWTLTLFLLLGLCTAAALNLPDKAHYHYFAILPIIVLSVFAINAALPAPYQNSFVLVFLACQLVFQSQYYYQWLNRPDRLLVHKANIEMIDLIEQNTQREVVPVIGQYSAQLALYSDTMVSLEVKWISIPGLCQRLEYWRPEFFVNFDYPQRVISEGDRLAKCEILEDFEHLAIFNVNEMWNDEVILYKLVYAQ